MIDPGSIDTYTYLITTAKRAIGGLANENVTAPGFREEELRLTE